MLGGIAGGVGAAIADLLGGYAQYALLTLLAHGLQGVVAGLLGRRGTLVVLLLGWVAGTVAMAGVYLLGEALVLQIGWANALAEAPFNLIQNLAGGLVGYSAFLCRAQGVSSRDAPRPWPWLARGLSL